ncbi:MAG: 50S ribosomal protein L6 [Candidatus Marinimicrobia bacterium]|jgi:large subunit ribosomal protein L6|nr:50S ribosomal protein L6 [Candidatus Neomarinimicrobiota bacterium]
MSRIGKNPINIPEGVTLEINKKVVRIKNQKGVMEVVIVPDIKVSQDDNRIIVERSSDRRQVRAMHGTTRQLIATAITGLSEGFTKELQLIGVGYQATMQGSRLLLKLGYSHDILFEPPENITITAIKNNITVAGFDKQLVGEVSAKIRSFRKPEPYKGKGIRYKDEYVRRKQGKTVGGVG